MSDYKNPHVQRSDEQLQGVSPWRPSAGPKEGDVAAFARHGPKGKVIYLPVGIYPTVDFAAMKRAGDDSKYFDLMTEGLEQSLRAARKDRANVFHVTVHPGEFRGGPREPYGVIERWLAEVVDPLVKAGKVRWATFSEMADAFTKWEAAHPGVDPREGEKAGPQPQPAARPAAAPRGYITFVINGPRPPFITSLIHENNFARSGPEGWTAIYFSDGKKRTPREPPYTLDAPDESRPRPADEQDRIWRAYEELVAMAASNLCVVTAEDIVRMAAAQTAAAR